METSKTAAVIVGAGSSSRMGENKIFINLLHKPTLAWTVGVFEKFEPVSKIIIVLQKCDVNSGYELGQQEGWNKVLQICEGGPRRQDSVKNGLDLVGDDYGTVMIHDAARRV